LESSADGWKLGGAAGIGQETEVTNAAESFRQHVEQETTDELINLERHHFGLVVGAIVNGGVKTSQMAAQKLASSAHRI